ncbi:MAG: right-handed parallel beta-helix repeat-containing protein [Woeseiaceae bacterium]
MKRLLVLISSTVLLSVALFSTALAGQYGNGFTAVSSCTYIGEPGKYRLTNNFNACLLDEFPFFPTGITIDANDVLLDLSGHTISCQKDELGNPNGFGILVGTYASNVRIWGGEVSGCAEGIAMVENTESSVRKMTISDNVIGVHMYGGTYNKISRNRIVGNDDGIFMAPFDVQGNNVGSIGHRVRKNLIADNSSFGIITDGATNSVFACNRTDRNIVGIGLTWLATDNIVKNNVANYNQISGITAFGFTVAGEVVQPVAPGNTFKRNSAMSNDGSDMSEILVELTLPDFPSSPAPECMNTWKKNQFGLQVGPMECIGTTRVFNDDDDGCAPEYDDDDDGGGDGDDD